MKQIAARKILWIGCCTVILFPFMYKLPTQADSNKGLVPGDLFYSARVYGRNQSLIDLGDFYIDSKPFSTRAAELFNFTEIVNRFLYKALPINPVTYYLISSFVILFLWIYVAVITLTLKKRSHVLGEVLVISICLLIVFRNSNFLDGYEFSRPISPQMHGLIWLIFLLCVSKYITHLSDPKKAMFWGLLCIAIVSISLFSYIFLFLATLSSFAFMILASLRREQSRTVMKLLIVSSFVLIPSITYVVHRRSSVALSEASQRLGLIETRLPGAFYSFSLSALIVLVILSVAYFSPKHKRMNSLEITILIASLGVLLASQSNVFTKRDVQFSYHFDVFTNLNLILLTSHYLVNLFRRMAHRFGLMRWGPKSSLVLMGIFLVLFAQSTPAFTRSHSLLLPNLSVSGYNENKPLVAIVDGELRESLPIFVNSKILFDGHIVNYGYTNNELNERLYISLGCKPTFSKADLQPVILYRIESARQKAERYRELFSNSKLFAIFDIAVKSLERHVEIEELEIQEELDSMLNRLSSKDCFYLARQYGVELILFDKESYWYNKITLSGLTYHQTSIKGIFSVNLN